MKIPTGKLKLILAGGAVLLSSCVSILAVGLIQPDDAQARSDLTNSDKCYHRHDIGWTYGDQAGSSQLDQYYCVKYTDLKVCHKNKWTTDKIFIIRDSKSCDDYTFDTTTGFEELVGWEDNGDAYEWCQTYVYYNYFAPSLNQNTDTCAGLADPTAKYPVPDGGEQVSAEWDNAISSMANRNAWIEAHCLDRGDGVDANKKYSCPSKYFDDASGWEPSPEDSSKGMYYLCPYIAGQTNGCHDPENIYDGTNTTVTSFLGDLNANDATFCRMAASETENSNMATYPAVCKIPKDLRPDTFKQMTTVADLLAAQYPPVTTGPSQTTSTCNTGSPLGWVICPVAELLGDFIDSIYSFIEETFLVIKADFLSSTSGTFKAWEKFRDIANIAFVIFMMVVILSQVTGFGITNYGIKKVLPKVIMTALLVNLSYILCQLAVDLSNIIGSQGKALFDNLAGSGTLTTFTTGGPGGGGVVAFILIGVGLIGLVAFGAIGGLIMILLSCLLAIVMAWLMLIVRQAAVVLLVAVAPLAFICYMLPGTESVFKKWLNIFKAMLLVYPIIGVVMGAGKLAGVIVQSSEPDNVAFMLIGVACTILPFFALPTLIKNSMAAMGALGAKISGLGNLGAGMRAKGKASMKAAPASSRLGRNIRGRVGNAVGNSKFGKSGFGRAIGANVWGARQIQAKDELDKKDTAAAAIMMKKAAFQKEGDLADEMVAAYGRGDVATANALHAELVGRGSKGIDQVHRVMLGAERAGNTKALSSWGKDVRENHSGTYKTKAYDLFENASTDGSRKIDGYDYADAIKGMEQSEIASQGSGFFARAASGGAARDKSGVGTVNGTGSGRSAFSDGDVQGIMNSMAANDVYAGSFDGSKTSSVRSGYASFDVKTAGQRTRDAVEEINRKIGNGGDQTFEGGLGI